MIDLVKLVNDYADFRKLETPDSREALLFLISEIGELAEADLEEHPEDKRGTGELHDIVTIGLLADYTVSTMKSWTRNGGRKYARNIARELADCQMMLIRYAQQEGLPDPVQCFIDKAKSYGFSDPIVDRLPKEFTPLCPYCGQPLDNLIPGKTITCWCGKKFSTSGKGPTLIEVP